MLIHPNDAMRTPLISTAIKRRVSTSHQTRRIMRNALVSCIFAAAVVVVTIPLSSAFSPLEAQPVVEGHAIQFYFAGEETKVRPEGIQRQLADHDDWQFFYICNEKNKKKCGKWIDKKDNEIKSANNNVKIEGENIVISNATKADTGKYKIIGDKNETGVEYNVIEGPKPPKH